MRREDVRSRIEGITDEQLDWLMTQYGAGVNAANARSKAAEEGMDALNARIGQLEAELKAKAEQGMSAEQLAEQRAAEAEAVRREYALKSNALDARERFIKGGVPEDAYSAIIERVVTEDAEQTAATVDAVIAAIASQRSAAEAATREAMLGEMPKPKGSGSAPKGVTREQFEAMTYRERLSVYNESPELYESLTKEGE